MRDPVETNLSRELEHHPQWRPWARSRYERHLDPGNRRSAPDSFQLNTASAGPRKFNACFEA